MITKKNSLKALAIAIASTTAIPALAVDSSVRLVNVALQDEARRLPADNSVMFTAANRRVSIALDVLAAGGDSSKLAGTMVTVVDATGNARKFAADNTGVVTIDDAKAGPHAVVASTDTAHGSSLFVFEEQAPAAADVAAAPARMTMLDISGEGLLPLINDYLGESEDSPFADDLGQVKAQTGASFGYQVALGAGGVLRGQVISIAAGQASLAGTTVTIFKDGQPVARDVTDADGSFEMTGVREGVHGLVAAGPAGYSAFAFEALPADGLTQLSTRSEMFVTKMNQAGSVLPVVLIPSQMVPAVVSSIRSFYPPVAGGAGGIAGGAGAAAAAGAAAFGSAGAMGAGQPVSSGGMAGGGGGGFGGGAAGAAGGAGGLGALASLGAIGAAVAVAADDDNEPGTPVSPFAAPVVNPVP